MSKFLSFLSKHRPGLLIGSGIGNMLLATISGILVTPMVLEEVNEKKEEQNVERLEPKDLLKILGKYYSIPMAFSITGIALIGIGNQENVDQGTAAMAAYALSESLRRDYREKALEVIGDRKDKAISEAMAKKSVEDHPVDNQVIIVTNGGNFLCYDKLTNQYFRSKRTSIDAVINKLNYDMRTSMTVTVNEYCVALGINTIELGDDLGWDINSNGLIEPEYTTTPVGDDFEPCIVIQHKTPPKYLH